MIEPAVAARIVHDAQAVYGYRTPWGEESMVDALGYAKESWPLFDDGRLVAVGLVFHQGDVAEVNAYVDPAERGHGLGSRLVRLGEDWAREHGYTRVRFIAYVGDDAAVRLFEQHGYELARVYFELDRALDDVPDVAAPAGIEIRPFRDDDARAFYDTLVAAFAGDPSFFASPFDTWRRRVVEERDTSLWRIAWSGATTAGVVRNEEAGGGAGWVAHLGVAAAYRCRGIGSALLAESFRAMRDAGLAKAALGVDTDDPHGAGRLYQRLGMSVSSRVAVYEKELP